MYLVGRNFYAKVSNSKKQSKSKNRIRSCIGKINHTETKAAQAAFDYNRRIVIRSIDVHSYECRHCRWWHIGHDYGDWDKEKQKAYQEAEADILLLLSLSPNRMALNKRTEILQLSMRGALDAAA